MQKKKKKKWKATHIAIFACCYAIQRGYVDFATLPDNWNIAMQLY